MTAYALLLEEEFHKEITKGVVEHAGGIEEIPLTKELKDRVIKLTEEIRQLKESPEMPSNFKKCESCFLKDKCYE